MNKNTYIIGALILVVVGGLLLNKSFSPSKQKIQTRNTAQSISTDPQDIVPGLYANSIKNTSALPGLTIQSGLVENNLNKNGSITSDHLELVLKNNGSQDMTNFETYYTVTDLVTAKKEGYYKKLTGFILKAGETKTINFDGGTGENHFGVNKNGQYFTSQNKLQFDIQVSTPSYKIATLQIIKDAGGAELKD